MTKATDWAVAFATVAKFEDERGVGESRGACQTIANTIQSKIGGTVVKGHIVMKQGDAQHWWVETDDGEIVDPLAVLWMDEPYYHIKLR